MSLDELLALLPDNTTGEIDAADLRTIVSQLWLKASGAGHVDSTGALVSGPTGWAAVRDDIGLYTVTHQLGIDPEKYAVTVTPMELETQAPAVAAVTATTTTSFSFKLMLTDGSPVSRDANFVMTVN